MLISELTESFAAFWGECFAAEVQCSSNFKLIKESPHVKLLTNQMEWCGSSFRDATPSTGSKAEQMSTKFTRRRMQYESKVIYSESDEQ